jgi:twitching motility protein PilT
LRQSPDVLFLSDIRDLETFESALVAAESGQLVLSCLHTTNAMTTIERLVAFFPPYQQQLIRLRLSIALKGLIALRLVPRLDGGGRIPACEILVSTPRVRDLIREGRTEDLPPVLHDGAFYGMQTFTQALYTLYKQGLITLEEALRFADSPEELDLAIQEIRQTRDVHAP